MATLLTKAEFARRIGKHRSYIYKLQRDGRLVLRDGKVDLEASNALIEQTADPARKKQGEKSRAYQEARTEEREFKAKLARLQLEERSGQLVRIEEVREAIGTACKVFKDNVLGLGAKVTPQIAGETDPKAMRAVIDKEARVILDEIVGSLRRYAAGDT